MAVLAILFALQLITPKSRQAKLGGILVFTASLSVVFGLAFYYSWQQYQIWVSDDLGKLFLPPHQNWDYFVFYARTRFFNPYLLSLFLALGFLGAAKKLNQKYEERFFEPAEPHLLATAVFLVGHPLWLFYLIILLAVSLILSLVISYWSLSQRRLPLYYFWLPAAIFTIMVSRWLSALPWWQQLKL